MRLIVSTGIFAVSALPLSRGSPVTEDEASLFLGSGRMLGGKFGLMNDQQFG
jgi:hypothetical protein